MKTLLLSASLLALVSSPAVFAASSSGGLTLNQKVSHLFDRLSYGPRPGDEEKLTKQGQAGIRNWIETQLHPERIADGALDEKLSQLRVPMMTTEQLAAKFPRPEMIAEKMGIKKEDFGKNEDLKKKIRMQIGEENLPEEIIREMSAQRLIRAVESRRQLQEVLADFWLNHFNIDITKGPEKWLLPEFEREAVRRHMFGKFSDLVSATAHSPAMLFYLDNQASHAGGINENYARELMELHTLGVDGGYSQSDVTQLARILTGWSIEDPRISPTFKFRERAHDRGEKIFLGQRFEPGHGQDEGERAIQMITHHPSTARFISTKLARYFVSDQPPKSLIDRMARNFRQTDGDLRALYSTLFNSPEFWSKAAYHSKVKKPVQFVVSAIRTLGGELEVKSELPRDLATMGEGLYRCPPPTGYKDEAAVWVNPGALVSRLNFASRLALNRVEGVYVQLPQLGQVPNQTHTLVRLVSAHLTHDSLSPSSEKVVSREFEDEHRVMADGEVRPFSLSKATALILGSPEFQRR